MATTPPTAQSLLRALVRNDVSCPLPAAAVFLASAVTAAPGTAAGADDVRMWVGGHTETVGGSVRATAEAAARLAAAAHRPGLVYLDLEAAPERWVKVLRSGWRDVAFGPDLLWGSPRVCLEGEGLGADGVAAFVRTWRTDPDMAFPALVTAPAPLLVDGVSGGRRVVLRGLAAAETPAEPDRPVAAVDAADDIAARVDGQVVRVSQSPTDLAWSVTLRVPEAGQMVVRYTVHAGSYQLLRSPTSVAAPLGDVEAVGGFVPVRSGALTCLLHRSSGVVSEPVPGTR